MEVEVDESIFWTYKSNRNLHKKYSIPNIFLKLSNWLSPTPTLVSDSSSFSTNNLVIKLQGWCRKWEVIDSKHKPLQSFYSVIRESKVEDNRETERKSLEGRTYIEKGSNLSRRHCQFEWAAGGCIYAKWASLSLLGSTLVFLAQYFQRKVLKGEKNYAPFTDLCGHSRQGQMNWG